MRKQALARSVTLYCGDCIEALKTLPAASIDSVVCDPPYGLEFMGVGWDTFSDRPKGKPRPRNEWGDFGSREHAREASEVARIQRKKGIAFQRFTEAWAREVFRVMKPGAHLVAFGGTRTYHRMACAIEDAGFEVRDTIAWLYGSGFPKSHDVSKGIDRLGPPGQTPFAEFARHYEQRRKKAGLSHAQVCKIGKWYGTVNHGGSSVNWANGYGMPTIEQWELLQPLLGLAEKWKKRVEREQYEREVIAKRSGNLLAVAPGQGNDRSATMLDITAPGSEAARAWAGFGTALKPAFEPIILARKPLGPGMTVAGNVLRYGTGGINIDGCRVAGDVPSVPQPAFNSPTGKIYGFKAGEGRNGKMSSAPLGRWPANLVLSYPEDEYMLRRDVTAEQRRELLRWRSENA